MTKEDLICPWCNGISDKYLFDEAIGEINRCECGKFEVVHNTSDFHFRLEEQGFTFFHRGKPDYPEIHIYDNPKKNFHEFIYQEKISALMTPKECREYFERWIKLRPFQ